MMIFRFGYENVNLDYLKASNRINTPAIEAAEYFGFPIPFQGSQC